MLYRIACFGVYGMCILLAVFIIEVSVVTTRSHGYVGNIKYILNFLTRIGRIVSWLVDTNMPRHLFIANTVYYDFSTNLNHKVADTFLFQESGNNVAAISFGDSRTVKHNLRILLDDASLFQGNFLITYQRFDTVYLGFRRRYPLLESKPPEVYHWGNRDIKGSICFF